MCSRHLTEMGSGVAEGQGVSQRPFSLIKLLIKRITAKREKKNFHQVKEGRG